MRHLLRRRLPLPLHHGGHGGDLRTLGGLHWWPKMTGKMYADGWARLSALLVFAGFNATFFHQFILGYLGTAALCRLSGRVQVLNVMSTVAPGSSAAGYALPMFYFIHSLFYSKPKPLIK
ncbi:MAG: cbb3-type cytochrome c oxidase subunit I [Bryobacteraceae bacterium]